MDPINDEGVDNAPEVTDEEIIESVIDEAQKKNIQTLVHKKKAWREKAIEPQTGKTYKDLYEESLKNINNPDKTLNPVKPKSGTEISDDIQKDVQSLKDDRQLRVFQHANGLTPEQADEVFAYARGMKIEPKDAMEKPFMKKVLEQMKSETEVANATLSPSRRSPVQIGGKTFKDMSVEERRKSFSQIARGKR